MNHSLSTTANRQPFAISIKQRKFFAKALCHLALIPLSGLMVGATLHADPTTYTFAGDKTPVESPYGSWFTTIGPGAPTSYFVGTQWSSDGDVLTMRTVHPNDYPGAPSLGIWFGITDGYGDPSGLGLSPGWEGNHVDLRCALAPNSSEWSLYWYDASGFGLSFYLLANGFQYAYANTAVFVPVEDMTAFHTYGSHIYNGVASFYFDGVLIGSGTAANGAGSFMVLGDGSATDVTGYGSLLVDRLDITVSAGAAPASVPEPSVISLLGLATICGAATRLRREEK